MNYYLLIGFGLLPRTVVPILLGLAVGLVIGVVGLNTWGLPALFAGMALGTLLVPGLQLPFLVRTKLKSLAETDLDERSNLQQQPMDGEGVTG